ncbi:hypothetical protein Q5P01_004508 [Channa striata]|uniref:Serpin domain-containing protein n=1 Tax=Channa striata TaxID=64152 RepID=A0AA88SXM9_CHASR|nr:hypothetical protein Q5P01_004508 [Channa striata]
MTRSITLTLVLLLLLLGPTSSETVSPVVQDLINRNADFATQLYRAVASRTDNNVLLSPFTLSAGLLALLSATSGATQDQLLQGLTLTGVDPMALPDLFQTLRTMVLQGEGTVTMRQSVNLLPSTNFQVSPSYQDLVQKLGGSVRHLAYSVPQEAVDNINRLVQEQTRDQIQELVTTVDSQTQLLLATATSYKTRFSPSFNSSLSQDERFYVDRYHVVMVPMMFRSDKYFLAYDRSLKVGVLKLSMADGTAMLVVLPDEGVDITAVEEEVTAGRIQAWIKQLKKRKTIFSFTRLKLEVQLPRFILEHLYSLKDVLQILGIRQVFQDDADMTNMGSTNGPKVTQVFHKSVVSVDERSDDITAGGGAAMFSTLPPRLTINRPFLFIIYQQTSSSLLLMGRVIDPTLK